MCIFRQAGKADKHGGGAGLIKQLVVMPIRCAAGNAGGGVNLAVTGTGWQLVNA
jgi:hypothetical protein